MPNNVTCYAEVYGRKALIYELSRKILGAKPLTVLDLNLDMQQKDFVYWSAIFSVLGMHVAKRMFSL